MLSTGEHKLANQLCTHVLVLFQKSTLVQGVILAVGVFLYAINTFQGTNASRFTVISPFVLLKDGETLCHQPLLNYVRQLLKRRVL